MLFRYQDSCDIHTWTDSDWAGDREDRRSTSGGVLLLGGNAVKHWSITQHVIALSVGEAEYYAIVKGSAESVGVQSLLRGLGIDAQIYVHTDSSTAKSIASRSGLGKVRHIDVNELWVQDKVRSGSITLVKANGKANLSDALTKHVTNQELHWHMEHTNQRLAAGRHPLAIKI